MDTSDIIAKTIPMQVPVILPGNKTKRSTVTNNTINEELISHEAFLRKLAYKNTSIKINDSFFDDSDISSEYFLVVIYDKTSNTPLLSCRYYFDKALIKKYLKGDNNSEEALNLNNYKDGEIFLADRLSGNISSSIYRLRRDQIFSLFYKEIVAHNKNCQLLLMVRKENGEKQLAKYLGLGFIVVDSTMHKGKEHWIILTDLKKS